MHIDILKALAQAAIDRQRDWIINIAEEILRTPETGFNEIRTSQVISRRLDEIGVRHTQNIAITGLKGVVRGGNSGPTVAVIGEMDSVRVLGHPHSDPVTGAAHACGHNCQPAVMLGAAVGLMAPEVLRELSGAIALMGVPAEEFIDVEQRLALYRQGRLGFMSGKQEMIRLGAFDDVDMALLVHTSASPDDTRFTVGGTSNGHVVKYVKYIGKASHAGVAPHLGVNALQAAMVGLHAVNTQRETFRDDDVVRLHGILTTAGVSTNSTPADVRYEGRVRGATVEAIADAGAKVDRCLKAGALALGAKVEIVTIPGYLPMLSNDPLATVFAENAGRLVGKSRLAWLSSDAVRGGGSTDMGDLSHIMPVIHPYSSGFAGNGHGDDYVVQDYEQAVITPAKVVAMTLIDLLSENAAKAREVVSRTRPRMTRPQYIALQQGRLKEEYYVGQ
ncbi:MAG: amidohydrolase [SAR202 cluster bacterium]|nr:amidohydrolase [SAR202 cluster bacterium]